MVAGRRRFLKIAAAAAGAALAAVGIRRSGLVGTLRSGFSETLRPRLDPTAPTGTLPPAALTTLVAFGEVVVVGEAIVGEGREAIRAALEEGAETRPGYRALCESAAGLLDSLAGGAFAALPIAERTAMVAEHRLGDHPAGRLELLWRDRAALAMRDLLVPELIAAYYDSPSGWIDMGYRRPYGECGDGREYTRKPA